MIVVKGDDIDRAEKWGGFVSWLGGVKPAEKRNLCKCLTSSAAVRSIRWRNLLAKN